MGEERPQIVERLWELEEMVYGDRTLSPEPGLFNLFLESEGKIRMRVDCNRGFGSYSLQGSSLSFGPLATTRAYCGDHSMDHCFEGLLSGVHGFGIQEGRLVLHSTLGRLVFRDTSSAPRI